MATAGAPPPRYAWLRPAPGVDLVHEQPWFLAKLNAVGATLRRVIDVFSGYRSDAQSVAGGGFAGDPHTRGIAADATISGVPIGRVRGAQAAIAGQGLRSGDQPNFYRGQPDPAHVDAAGAPTAARGSGKYAQIKQVWLDEGGPSGAADEMAAVALAESHGNASAHNYNPGTGDDSWGWYQINYYGDLRPSRVARFGPPEGLLNPRKCTRAAIAIYNSSGPTAWSTYKSGAYRAYLGGGGTSGPGSIRARPASGGVGSTLSGWFGDAAGAVEGAAEGGWKALIGVVDGPLAIVKAALWLLNPQTWLRATEFVVGIGLMVLGLLGLATTFAMKSPAVRTAAGAASLAPGPIGAGARAVSAVPVRPHVRRRPGGTRGRRGDRTPPAETAPPPRPKMKARGTVVDDRIIRL